MNQPSKQDGCLKCYLSIDRSLGLIPALMSGQLLVQIKNKIKKAIIQAETNNEAHLWCKPTAKYHYSFCVQHPLH